MIKDIIKDVNIPNEEKYVVDKNIVWHYESIYAFSNDMYDIIEVDIKSAFFTFIKLYFSKKYKDLILKLEKENDKRKRNILISTTLSSDELKLLNILCKAHLLSFMFSNFLVLDMLEIKKDGGVFVVLQKVSPGVVKFKNVEFKIKKLEKYLHFNNTSFYFYDSKNLTVKGRLKHIPAPIYDFYIEKIPFGKIQKLYSPLYFKILKSLKSKDEIENLFLSKDKRLYLKNGKFLKYENFNDLLKINPNEYFKIFIDPFISLVYFKGGLKT